MDNFTKRKVRRALKENPDLPVRFVINAIRASQQRDKTSIYVRDMNMTDQLEDAKKEIINLECRNMKLEKQLMDMSDEIKGTDIGVLRIGDNTINIPQRHWTTIRAMGEDAARLVRGEL